MGQEPERQEPERQAPDSPQANLSNPLFKTRWLAGFEGACHINIAGQRLDMLVANQHDRYVRQDYALLKTQGIETVRDGVRWTLIEKNGSFDFSSLAPFVEAAEAEGIQVIWTLCHYGWPDDVDVFAENFPERFARFAKATARYISDHSSASPANKVPFYTPINEISFLSWAICHTGLIYPYASFGKGRDGFLKRQLIRASIAASDAIWEVDPRAQLVTVDPLIHVIPPLGREEELAEPAARQRESQFESWDILTGRIEPELGGHPQYAGAMGVNYYHHNQWEHLTHDTLLWHLKDPRRVPLHILLEEIYQRYQAPLFIGETSHVGVGRAEWIEEVAADVGKALENGVPVEGICLYPIIDRHDWDNPHHWHNSGLWDLLMDADGRLHRVIDEPYEEGLRRAQQQLYERYRRAGQH